MKSEKDPKWVVTRVHKRWDAFHDHQGTLRGTYLKGFCGQPQRGLRLTCFLCEEEVPTEFLVAIKLMNMGNHRDRYHK